MGISFFYIKFAGQKTKILTDRSIDKYIDRTTAIWPYLPTVKSNFQWIALNKLQQNFKNYSKLFGKNRNNVFNKMT